MPADVQLLPDPPEGGDVLVEAPHGLRIALAALALGGVGIGTGEFVPVGLLPNIAHGVHVPITSAGHTISAYALGVVVGAPVIAVLTARLPKRALLVGLMLAFTLGNLLSAIAPDYGTLMAARFLTGLPHGAYFGIASLVAASMVPVGRRTWAVGQVLLGLALANLAIVPALTALGQAFSWRLAFGLVAALGLGTAVLVLRCTPDPPADLGTGMRSELGALTRPAVLAVAAIGAVGFGGMFAVYSYISPIMTDRAGLDVQLVPIILVIWGAGMVAGNTWATKLIDRWPDAGTLVIMAGFTIALLVFAVVSTNPYLAAACAAVLGVGVVLGPALQTRLMDLAGDAQNLAASLNHAAFNVANALGAFLAGIAYDHTGSWESPPLVGAMLSAAGFVMFLTFLATTRRAARA